MPMKAIVEGDRLIKCISAASIIAKVTHDRIMTEFHNEFPEYNFDKHKGYPTKNHQTCLSNMDLALFIGLHLPRVKNCLEAALALR